MSETKIFIISFFGMISILVGGVVWVGCNISECLK